MLQHRSYHTSLPFPSDCYNFAAADLQNYLISQSHHYSGKTWNYSLPVSLKALHLSCLLMPADQYQDQLHSEGRNHLIHQNDKSPDFHQNPVHKSDTYFRHQLLI